MTLKEQFEQQAQRVKGKLKKVAAPKDSDLSKCIGKMVRTMDGEVVLIQTIVGSQTYPTRFEINGAHHVVILDFYRQMNHDRSITDEQVKEFDEMTFEVEREPQKLSAIDNVNVKGILDGTTKENIN